MTCHPCKVFQWAGPTLTTISVNHKANWGHISNQRKKQVKHKVYLREYRALEELNPLTWTMRHHHLRHHLYSCKHCCSDMTSKRQFYHFFFFHESYFSVQYCVGIPSHFSFYSIYHPGWKKCTQLKQFLQHASRYLNSLLLWSNACHIWWLILYKWNYIFKRSHWVPVPGDGIGSLVFDR